MAKTKKILELPLKGKGVEPVRIAELDRLAEDYVKQRDRRLTMTPKEVAAKHNLIEAMHQHTDQIGKQPDGSLVYRFDETLIRLSPGKEKLKVEDISEEIEE
jgi:hypothetical protein